MMIDDEKHKDIQQSSSGSTSKIDETSENNTHGVLTQEVEELCRICRSHTEPNRPLFHPCECRGSIKFVHEDCLMNWIKHSNSKKCELCKREFKFLKVYAANTPKKLSSSEIVLGLLQILGNSLYKIWRLLLVISVWIIITPLITSWICHAYFSESFSDVLNIYKRIFNYVEFFKDIVIGSFLSAFVLCIGLSAAAFREFIVNNHELLNVLQQDNAAVPNQNNPNVNNDVNDQDINRQNEAIENVEDIVQNDQEPPLNNNLLQPDDNDDANESDADTVDSEDVLDVPPIQHEDLIWNNNNQQNQNVQQHENNQNNIRQDENNDEAEDPNELELEEIIGFNGPLSTLFGSFVVLMLSNTVFLTVFVYIPLLWGTSILKLLSLKFQISDFYQNLVKISAGYATIFISAIFWILISSITSKLFQKPIDAFSLYAIKIARYVLTFFKIVVMIHVNFVLTPIYCGLVLNLSTADFFDKTLQSKIDQITNELISAVITHWVLGLLFLFQVSFFVKILREILHPRVLWFLNNPDDPNFSYLQEVVRSHPLTLLRRILMTLTLFAVLIFTLVRAPLKLCRNIAPGIFPLMFNLSDPLLQWSIDLMIIWFISHIGIENIRPKVYIKLFLHRWLEEVGSVLGLSSYLFEQRNENNNEEVPIVNTDIEEEEGEIPQEYNRSSFFVFRIIVLLIMVWCTALVLISIIIMIPLVIGRTLFTVLPLTKAVSNDIYVYIFGIHIIGGFIYCINYLWKQIRTYHMFDFISTLSSYLILSIKCASLGFLWFVFLPVLIGVLIQRTIFIPVLVPLEKTPITFTSEVWAMGISVLAMWMRLVLAFNIDPWKTEIETAKQNGLRNLDATRIFCKLILPALYPLSIIVFAPHIIVKLVFPNIFDAIPIFSQEEQLYFRSCVLRIWYPLFAFSLLALKMLKLAFQYFNYLHSVIYDDRYLVSTRLVNLDPQSMSR